MKNKVSPKVVLACDSIIVSSYIIKFHTVDQYE